MAAPQGLISGLTLSSGSNSITLWPSANRAVFVQDIDFGFPTIRDNVVDRVGASGTLDYTSTFGASVVSLTLRVLPSDGMSVQAWADQLRAYLNPRNRPVLTWTPVGATQRYFNLRPGNAQYAFSMQVLKNGSATIQLQFKAPDGRAFGVANQVITITPNAGLAGRHYPRVYPWSYQSTAPQSWATTVGGNIETLPVIRLHGGMTSPVLTHVDQGLVIGLAGYVLAAGRYIDVNLNTKTVTLDDGTNLRSALTSRGWFVLNPGLNNLRLATDVFDTNANAVFTFQPAFI